MAHDKSNPVFNMRFVATERGVKAESRVKGRIAFPSNRGEQPKDGETWKVKIAGDNPKHTVYFLTCVEKVESPSAAVDPALVRSRRFPTDVGNTLPPAAVRAKVATGAPASTMFVQDYLFGPGGDAYAQAVAWLTPIEKIDLANLKFAHAQKLGFADYDAVTIGQTLSAGIKLIDEARSTASALKAELKGFSQKDREAAEELTAARQQSKAAAEAKRKLNVDTLAYGRLVQKLNKAGDNATVELRSLVPFTKNILDTERKRVHESVEAAKKRLDDAELGRLFACSEEAVDQACAIIADIEIFETAEKTHLEALEQTVRKYEDRIEAIRKSA